MKKGDIIRVLIKDELLLKGATEESYGFIKGSGRPLLKSCYPMMNQLYKVKRIVGDRVYIENFPSNIDYFHDDLNKQYLPIWAVTIGEICERSILNLAAYQSLKNDIEELLKLIKQEFYGKD